MSQPMTYADRPWLDPEAEPFIKVQSVSKHFGDFTAVDSVDLDIYKGELFCLLGGSGCGKSTLLRMLAGFETPSSGSIIIDGANMNHVPPYERPVNMMFQSYALFPHMTVESNVAYGLKRDGVAKAEIDRQVDEPLAALDKRLREQTQFELMNIQDKVGVTFVVVTHDQEEAMTLSTRIAVMDAGRFMQIGTPTEIYEFPTSRLVANFIGNANMFEGRITENGQDHVIVQSTQPECQIYIDHGLSIQEGTRVWVALRPEKIRISKQAPDNDGFNMIKGMVDDIGYLGGTSTYRIKIDGDRIVEITSPNQARPKDGNPPIDWDEEVYLSWDASSSVVLTK